MFVCVTTRAGKVVLIPLYQFSIMHIDHGVQMFLSLCRKIDYDV